MNNFDSLDTIFEALSNKHRREIIYLLGLHPHTITQLVQTQKLSFPAIHKHIRMLEKSDLILRKKVGRLNFLAINRKSLRNLQEWVMQYQPYWGDDKETLDNYVQFLQKETKGGEKI